MPLNNIKDAFKVTKSAVQGVLNKRGYEINSSGTRDLALNAAINPITGFWSPSASNVSNKPPRWILHLRNTAGQTTADLARNPAGAELTGAGLPGYLNNREGKCAVAIFRIIPAIQDTLTGGFIFPADWEWLLVVAFPNPLPAGTSGETLSGFNPAAGTFDYKGNVNPAKTAYKVSCLGLVLSPSPCPAVSVGGTQVTYQDATAAIKAFLASGGTNVIECDPANNANLALLANTIDNAIGAALPAAVKPLKSEVEPASSLMGIRDDVYKLINAALAIGKRHFIFYGPPGTGKTTLAEHVADQIAEDGSSFVELTASASWSSQDLIGGYQPLGPGEMGFVPGALLRDFDKPMIIDELNRCPIDKVIGPLFSVLAGQASTLPYRLDVSDKDSGFYKILPVPTTPLAPGEFAPGPAWSLICTLNQVDKTQLGQLSFALSRRFAWIRIGVPEDPRAFVTEILESELLLKGPKDTALPNPVADMWVAVNAVREIGGAPIIDFIRLVGEMDGSIDMLSSPPDQNTSVQDIFIMALGTSVLPLLDGIRRMEAESLLEGISAAWKLDDVRRGMLRGYVMDLSL